MAEEISKFSGLVRNCLRGSPHSASKKSNRAISSIKRSRIAVDSNDDVSKDVDCSGFECMDNHSQQSSFDISSSILASSTGTIFCIIYSHPTTFEQL